MLKIFEVNREQFFKLFPPETRNIMVNDEVVARLGEEVICDYCNCDVFFDPEDHAFLVSPYENPTTTGHITEVLCKDCAMRIIKENEMVKE